MCINTSISTNLTACPQDLLSLYQRGGGEARSHFMGLQDAVRGGVVRVVWHRRLGARGHFLREREPCGLGESRQHGRCGRGRKGGCVSRVVIFSTTVHGYLISGSKCAAQYSISALQSKPRGAETKLLHPSIRNVRTSCPG